MTSTQSIQIYTHDTPHNTDTTMDEIDKHMLYVISQTIELLESTVGRKNIRMKYIHMALRNAGTLGFADITDAHTWCEGVQEDKTTHVCTLLRLAIPELQKHMHMTLAQVQLLDKNNTSSMAEIKRRVQAVLRDVAQTRDFAAIALHTLQAR